MNIDPQDSRAFNGTHFKGFICLFEHLAADNSWNENVKLSHFRKSLKGPAADFFSTLPQSTRCSYIRLKERFWQHYDPRELPFVAGWEAQRAKQRMDESVYEFRVRMDELMQKTNEDPDQTIGIEVFLKGLSDHDMAFSAFQQNPRSLDDAFQAVTSMASLR